MANYPGDSFGDQLGKILFDDYAEAHHPIDSGIAIWMFRVAWDASNGLDMGASIARHRASWREALGLGTPAATPSRPSEPPQAPSPVGGLRVDGGQFKDASGQVVQWRGCTDFRLLERFLREDITPTLAQRRDLGFNLVRVLGMKFNNTGWPLAPTVHPGILTNFFDFLASQGFYCEFTVLVDTGAMEVSPANQQVIWATAVEAAKASAHGNVLLELCNEWDHPTQHIDPSQFTRPDGVVASHGSGQTDADTVQPRWDYASYHARRDGAKGITNYDPYEFQALYPQPVPLVPDEGAKPEQYRGDPLYAYLMGKHAGCGWGGTFHTDAGIDSHLFDPTELSCAQAFVRGLRGQPL